MKKWKMAHGHMEMPAIIQGCMRIAEMGEDEAEKLIMTDMEVGINMFDHADIYGGGESQVVFSKVLHKNPDLRDKIIIQSKVGITNGIYDFSKQHIIEGTERNLQSLGIDELDILLLHRPDPLMQPDEVAEALDKLHRQGKVRYFGVSNQTPGMMQLLEKYMPHKLHFNQLQFGLMHTGMIDQGITMNTTFDGSVDRDGGILHYCWLNGVTIQAWSPYQYGHMEGAFLGNDKFAEVNKVIDEIAQAHNVQPEAIPAAFILRHPANIQTVIGTTRADRVRAIAAACDFTLSREEWFKLYKAAGNKVP